jgi:DNA-directed RNA polymerase specialized sigma24 family protein
MTMDDNPLQDSEEWFALLRARFIEIARRRVDPETVEDVVHEALAIIHEKVPSRGRGTAPPALLETPSLPWCMTVLRNVIGNHYQRTRTRSRAADPSSAEHTRVREALSPGVNPAVDDAMERRELARVVQESIRALAEGDPACAEHIRAWLAEAGGLVTDGNDPRARGRTKTSSDYVRAFRCRRKLRALLIEKGVRV